MNSGYKHILLLGLIALVSGFKVVAQNTEKSATRIQIAYFKDHNRSETIVATLKIKDKQFAPFENAEVNFYCLSDTSKILLDKISTDSKGEAIYLIKDNNEIYKNSSGAMTFEVEYEGNPSTDGASKTLEVKPLKLDISFYQEDTAKYIAVKANEIGPDNSNTPIEGLEIALYIKGTFSLLNIGKDVTDQGGKMIFPFPVDMPGDTLGVVTIVAKVEENDVYANVESLAKINWAQPVPLAKVPSRGLGDTDAPLWMVYTLIVLLSAVWFHYLYVLFLIIKIKLSRNSI